MKKKNLILAAVALLGLCAALFLHAAPNYTGPAAAPDNFGNVTLGNPSWFPANTVVSNTALGVSAGTAITSGTNNLYLANVGANETGITRIGTAGTQTNIYLSGPVTSTPLTNVTVIAQGSTGFTNNLTADVFVYIYPTNYAYTVYAGFQGTNAIITAGAFGLNNLGTIMLPPNWCIVGTNISGKVVNSL